MTNAEKYPEIWNTFTKLQAEREAIYVQTEPLKQQRDDVRKRIDVLRAEEQVIVDQIKTIEKPRLIEIDNDLSRLAQAMGGKRVSDAG